MTGNPDLQSALRAMDAAVSAANGIACRTDHPYAAALRLMWRDVGLMVDGHYPAVTPQPVVFPPFDAGITFAEIDAARAAIAKATGDAE